MINTLLSVIDRRRNIFSFKIWHLIENLVKSKPSREKI